MVDRVAMGAIVAVIACSGGAIGCSGKSGEKKGDAPFHGSATVEGSVTGAPPFEEQDTHFGVAPGYIFVGTAVASRHYEVVITDFADTCGNGDVIGQILYFDLFQNPSLEDSTVTEPGTYRVWAPALDGSAGIPTDNVVVGTYGVVGDDGGRAWVAQSGVVDVLEVSDGVLSATFDLVFSEGALSGSFTSAGCDEWGRGANIPRPGVPVGGAP